jgi:hypothetical protein
LSAPLAAAPENAIFAFSVFLLMPDPDSAAGPGYPV